MQKSYKFPLLQRYAKGTEWDGRVREKRALTWQLLEREELSDLMTPFPNNDAALSALTTYGSAP